MEKLLFMPATRLTPAFIPAKVWRMVCLRISPFTEMKKGDEAISMIGVYFTGAFNVNSNASFRKMVASFFGDEPQIVEKINNKDFKVVECVNLFEAYNQLQGEKKK